MFDEIRGARTRTQAREIDEWLPVLLEPRRYVLDANALTGFFEDRGLVAEKVRHLLGDALRHEERFDVGRQLG